MTRRAWLGALFPAAAGASISPTPDLSQIARRIFEKSNEIRLQSGVPPLAWSPDLAECARRQSERKRLLRFRGHEDPVFGGIADRVSRVGVAWNRCAENLFELRGYEDPTDYALVFWWYSSGHQANLLNPVFRQSAVAVAMDTDDRFFVTQVFVEPANPVKKTAPGKF